MKRGWTLEEKQLLIKKCQQSFKDSIPLKNVFDNFAKQHNRKRDSVRNFYYASVAESGLRGEHIDGIVKGEIEMFSAKEIEKFMTKIMNEIVKGSSVRKAIMKLDSDSKMQLRYQNKYRNLVKAKSAVIYKIIEKQKLKGKYYDPFAKVVIVLEKTENTLVKDDSVAKLQSVQPLSQKLKTLGEELAPKKERKRKKA